MNTIWKFQVHQSGVRQALDMPRGAKLLHLGVQSGQVYIWAQVDTAAPRVRRQFELVGTGYDLGDVAAGDYVGTVFLQNGALVLHGFDLGEL